MKNKFILASLVFSLQALKAATVSVEVLPKSSSGEPITLRFRAINAENVDIEKAPSSNSDWIVQGPQRVNSTEAQLINGQFIKKSSTDISFLLQPLKKGLLKLPQASIRVDSKIYTSPETPIKVSDLSRNKNPTTRSPVQGFPLDDFFDNNDPNNQILQPPNNGQNPRALNVFVMGEPSKTEVYVGELITLPFYIYANENVFRNIEFAGFPTFQDFLKEELYLPRTWKSDIVKYRNESFWRSEIIRFALFPIKDGPLVIDPLKMRVEMDVDLFQVFDQMMQGQNASPPEQKAILKSSGAIPIQVKALPPKAANIHQSVIPVGEYQAFLTAPTGPLIQNEVFGIKMKILGQGNIKGLPEPELQIPDQLQKSKVNSTYEFDESARGFKEFEFLYVPRQSGVIIFPENTWTFFNPNKSEYESIKLPSLQLNVEASNKKSAQDAPLVSEQVIFGGPQSFIPIQSKFPLWMWIFPLLSYAFASLIFYKRKKAEAEEALRLKTPWVLIERKILSLPNLQSLEALQLVESWILSRFTELLHEEAAFEDIADKIRSNCHPSVATKIDRLEEKFKAIENLRFGMGQRNIQVSPTAISFEEIKRLADEICYSSSVSESESETEDS